MSARWQTDSTIYRKYIRQLMELYQKRTDIRVFTEILLSAAAIFVFGIFAIRPTLVTITSLNTEINEKKEIVSLLNTKIDNIILAQERYDNNRDLISLLQTAVPDTASPLEFAAQIDLISKKNEVSVVTFSLDDAPLIGDINPLPDNSVINEGLEPVVGVEQKTLPVSISVSGTYAGVSQFLSDVENMRRPLKLESLLIALSDPKDDSVITLTVVGLIPYIPKI